MKSAEEQIRASITRLGKLVNKLFISFSENEKARERAEKELSDALALVSSDPERYVMSVLNRSPSRLNGTNLELQSAALAVKTTISRLEKEYHKLATQIDFESQQRTVAVAKQIASALSNCSETTLNFLRSSLPSEVQLNLLNKTNVQDAEWFARKLNDGVFHLP